MEIDKRNGNVAFNDLNHKYLKDDSPAYIASKYLHKLDSIMNDEWKSDIINNCRDGCTVAAEKSDEESPSSTRQDAA